MFSRTIMIVEYYHISLDYLSGRQKQSDRSEKAEEKEIARLF